ncbi:MAG: alpha/beta hydrolase [Bacteroidetes bacterium]|nr:alpha/beta hydrolase [Bacteroidota bacterium]
MLNYITSGNGHNQIIFIHGNSQSSDYWKYLLESTLKDNYSLVALDLPGCGKSFKSETPDKDYSIRGLSKNVKEFISKFDSKEYVVVAFSLAANVIGEIAQELNNCKGILLLSPTIIGFSLTPADILKPNPNLVPLFTATTTEEQLNTLTEELGYKLPSSIKKEIKTIYNNVDPNFRTSMAASIALGDYSDELQNVQNSHLPIAVVFGEEDKLCFNDYIDKTLLTQWRGKSILVPNSGHCVMLDQPYELIKIVNEFATHCF